MLVAAIVALRIAGLSPRTLALGGAVDGRDRRARGPADARQPDRGHRAAERATVPGGRARAPAGRAALAGSVEGAVSAARPALHDASPSGDDRSWCPNSVVLTSRRGAAARARRRRTCGRACALASRPATSRSSCATRSDADPRRAPDHARGARRRRGRRASRGDPDDPPTAPSGKRGAGCDRAR